MNAKFQLVSPCESVPNLTPDSKRFARIRSFRPSALIRIWLTVLCLCGCLPSARADDVPVGPTDNDDIVGPYLPGLSLQSTRTIISLPAGTSYQVNVSGGHNIAGDAANEASMCMDPNNHNTIAIAWRQFDTTNSNFRQ